MRWVIRRGWKYVATLVVAASVMIRTTETSTSRAATIIKSASSSTITNS